MWSFYGARCGWFDCVFCKKLRQTRTKPFVFEVAAYCIWFFTAFKQHVAKEICQYRAICGILSNPHRKIWIISCPYWWIDTAEGGEVKIEFWQIGYFALNLKAIDECEETLFPEGWTWCAPVVAKFRSAKLNNLNSIRFYWCDTCLLCCLLDLVKMLSFTCFAEVKVR